MSKREFNKAEEYGKYRFNIKVELHSSAVRTPGGVVTHLITINDMGVTNYYRTYECISENLEATINTAIDNAHTWVDARENRHKAVEELLLEKLGFE